MSGALSSSPSGSLPLLRPPALLRPPRPRYLLVAAQPLHRAHHQHQQQHHHHQQRRRFRRQGPPAMRTAAAAGAPTPEGELSRAGGAEEPLSSQLNSAASNGSGVDSGNSNSSSSSSGRSRGSGGLRAVLSPLSDPSANSKLLALCLAQMLASVATLMHDTYLPLYMSEVLHMSSTKMGNLHALLQFLARASGVVSGRLADILSPARMVILGTALTACCKPMFALSGAVHAALGARAAVPWLACAKIFDRTSKGVREAPSKALVGDLAALSGDSPAAAFSLRQSLSTLGMLIGSGAASLAFHLSRSYLVTFALSAVPAALGLLLLLSAFGKDGGASGGGNGGREGQVADSFGGGASGAVTKAGAGAAGGSSGSSNSSSNGSSSRSSAGGTAGLGAWGKARALLGALRPAYWQAVAVVFILYCARFDVAFITLHASTVMDTASLPLLTLFSMAPVVVLAAPMGLRAKASVRARNEILLLGISVLILGNLCMALMPSLLGIILGSMCIGVHMSMTQGVSFGMLASYIPSHEVVGLGRVSGTVWSLTDLLLGVALACSNAQAGRLCEWTVRLGLGSTGCFWGGSAACAASMLALLLFSKFGELGKEGLVHTAAKAAAARAA